MLPLRFPKLWAGLGWLLVLAVIVGSLIPSRMVEIVDVDDKIRHAVAYCLLMVWFAGFYRRTLYPMIAAVLVSLGIVLDLLQSFTVTRFFDWHDIGMNCAGVALGLAVSVFLLGGWCQRVEQRLLS